MKYGFSVPTRGPLANADSLVALAQHGEEMGFDFVGVSDHIIIPKDIRSRYPYSLSGEFAGADPGECLEQLTVVAYLAAATSKIKLLTTVLVLPHRNPVHTAKVFASIDVLSGGRLIAGCGVGWMREEFEALGAPPFDKRGAVSDEYLKAFKELWAKEDPEFDGEFVSFSNVRFAPQPVQKPHPPIWIGGESPPALRRSGRLADAWYPIGNNPRYPMETIEQVKKGMDTVRRHAAEAGRSPDDVSLSYSAGWYTDDGSVIRTNGDRRLITGSADQVAGDISALAEAGTSHLSIGLQADTLDDTLRRMDRFASTIMPRVAT